MAKIWGKMKKGLLQLAFKLLPTQRQLPKLKPGISLVVKICECNFFSDQTIHIPIFNPVDLLGKGTQTFTSPAIETTTLRSISTSSTVSINLQKMQFELVEQDFSSFFSKKNYHI